MTLTDAEVIEAFDRIGAGQEAIIVFRTGQRGTPNRWRVRLEVRKDRDGGDQRYLCRGEDAWTVPVGTITTPRITQGTPRYLSIDVIDGEESDADPRVRREESDRLKSLEEKLDSSWSSGRSGDRSKGSVGQGNNRRRHHDRTERKIEPRRSPDERRPYSN